MFFLELISWYC